jgi:hypothetical protein
MESVPVRESPLRVHWMKAAPSPARASHSFSPEPPQPARVRSRASAIRGERTVLIIGSPAA